ASTDDSSGCGGQCCVRRSRPMARAPSRPGAGGVQFRGYGAGGSASRRKLAAWHFRGFRERVFGVSPEIDHPLHRILMAPDSSRAAQIAALETYIRETWPKLTRSVQTLCQSATDPKTGERPGSPHILYLSPRENEQAVERRLRECMSAEDFARIEIRPIPG